MKHVKKIMNRIKDLQKMSVIFWRKFGQDGCFMRAGSLAYVTLLSLVPLLTVSFTVLSAFPMFKVMGQKIQDLIFENFVAESAQSIQGYLQTFITQSEKLSIIGMLFLLVTAVFLVFTMEQTFNAIWQVKRNRHGVTAFLLYWAVITLIPLAIAAAIWVTSSIVSLPLLSHLKIAFIGDVMIWVAPYFATFIVFTLLYIALPNCKVPVRSALIAALVATILFEFARKGFTIYISNFTAYTIIYGAVATIPIFLLWLYVSWVVVLFGAVVNSVLAKKEI